MLRKVANILVIEDDPAHAGLLRESLKQIQVPFRLRIVGDGAAAVRLLNSCAPHECPDLIFLDLDLPGLNGHEVLQAIRSNPSTSAVPVVVLSASRNQSDVEKAYDARANCFIVKPHKMDDFVKVIAVIEQFWLGVAELPSR